MKSVSPKDICTPILIAALSTIAKVCKQPKCTLMDKWLKKIHTTQSGINFSLEKRGNLVICNSIKEPGGHYAKGNEPERETQILHDLTYAWNLKFFLN